VTTTPNGRSILFWDMAGTLLSRDRRSGDLVALPGANEVLPRLRRDYALHVTTMDWTASARQLLRDAGLLEHFHGVHGDLAAPAGKPYGALAAELGARPERCLAVGDSLRGDLPSDSDRVVTVLVNQESFGLHAAAIELLLAQLRRAGPTLHDGFMRLHEGTEPVLTPDLLGGPDALLRRRRDDGLEYYLTLCPHPALDGQRPLVVIPG
jgi:hypothetical protein